ncbi:MAG: zinc ribbon domain-containing protein [Bdellovibrionales bacterium]|nr:zinc ribbon domain-containing protein [Bdellovibrionales bacterium]
MKHENWRCSKCNHYEYETDQFPATSGKFLLRIFDFQNRKFTTVICKKCQFTEIHKTTPGKLESILDILSGGQKTMKAFSGKISRMIGFVILYSLTFPCFGGEFFWETSSSNLSYAEHLEWQKSFQWERKQAFKSYKRNYNHYRKQKKNKLQRRLSERNTEGFTKQKSLLKRKWDAKQKTYQNTLLKLTKDYIKKRNQHRKQKKSRGYSPKRSKYSREFVL